MADTLSRRNRAFWRLFILATPKRRRAGPSAAIFADEIACEGADSSAIPPV